MKYQNVQVVTYRDDSLYMQDSRHICIEQKYDHDETLD
jgi:hypothetical protein